MVAGQLAQAVRVSSIRFGCCCCWATQRPDAVFVAAVAEHSAAERADGDTSALVEHAGVAANVFPRASIVHGRG